MSKKIKRKIKFEFEVIFIVLLVVLVLVFGYLMYRKYEKLSFNGDNSDVDDNIVASGEELLPNGDEAEEKTEQDEGGE